MGELGFGDGAVFRNLPSPFDPAQYRVSVNTRMDTRFRARSRGLQALADAIEDWLRRTPGNCIVYFPAYQYMADVLGLLQGKLPERQILVQRRQQGEADRNALLDALQERTDVVAFCILGGVFGEGIDLPGDALRSVIIVGVGLPQFDRQRQVLRDYYDAKSGQGFEFAYLYPGMQRVGQALGRVIRRESDTGSALLIDSRYAEPAYRGLLPPWWEYVDAE
jgi:DNA excision repair protein ERCC-2